MAADKRARKTGRQSNDGGRHLRLYRWVTDTAAWSDMDTVARCSYLELLFLYYGCNNGRIALGVRTLANRLGVSKNTAARSLKTLEAHGFIAVVQRGAFSRKLRHATEYRITEFGCDKSGALATKDFVYWKKTVSPQVPTVSPEIPIGTCDDTVQYGKSGETRSTVSAEVPKPTPTVSPGVHT